MNSKLVIFTSFTSLAILCQNAYATDEILKKLLDKGYDKSITIETQNINYSKVKNNTWRSYAALLPTLSASTSRTYTRTKDYVDEVKTTSTTRSDALTVTADWTIWDNFSNVNTLRSSKMSEHIEKHKTDLGEQFFYNQIVELYFTIQELIYKKDSTQELYEQAKKAKEEALFLINLGQKTKFEATDAEIDMVNAERDLMEIKNELETNNRNLKYLIGAEEIIEIPAIDLLKYRPFFLEKFEKSFNEYKSNWKENYENKNQSMQISKLEFEQAGITYFGEKLSLFPSLKVSASNTLDYGYKVKQNVAAYNNTPKNDLSLSISASWTMWDFWATPKKVESARLDFKVAEINYLDQKIKVQTEIQNTIDQYEINQKSVEASKLVLDKAIQNYEYNSYMYKLGKINLLTRQRAMTQLHSAKMELASRLKNKFLLSSQLMIKFGEKIYIPHS